MRTDNDIKYVGANEGRRILGKDIASNPQSLLNGQSNFLEKGDS